MLSRANLPQVNASTKAALETLVLLLQFFCLRGLTGHKMQNSGTLQWSLQTRIVLLAGFVSVSVLAIVAWVGAVSAAKVVENDISTRSVEEAGRLIGTLEEATETSLPPDFQSLMAELLELVPSVTRVDLYVEEGGDFRPLASSSFRGNRTPSIQERDAFRERQIQSFEVDDDARRQLFTVHPFSFRNGNRGFLTVSTSLEVVDRILSSHSRIGIYGILVSVAVLLIAISSVFRSTVYRNVQHLADVMAQFKEGDASIRSREDLPGEFRSLARHLNLMLTEIQTLHEEMQDKIDLATNQLEARNRELETLNLLLSESQKRLIQAERLALTGQVTAAFAHEIGSPLGAVSTQLQLLLEETELTPEIDSRLQMANAEIDRVCGIVRSLLSTTRRKRPQHRTQLEEIIERVAALLQPILDHREIHFKLVSEARPSLVLGDEDQLQQLFLNLFNNSIDAMKASGSLLVELSRLRDKESGLDQNLLQIQVRDNGVGIPSERLSSIFEPFYTSKELEKGTGLGLVISREIVRLHGGQISVESEFGHGTCVTVILPEMDADKANMSGAGSPKQELS
jgi:signal transduction histidine kinase